MILLLTEIYKCRYEMNQLLITRYGNIHTCRAILLPLSKWPIFSICVNGLKRGFAAAYQTHSVLTSHYYGYNNQQTCLLPGACRANPNLKCVHKDYDLQRTQIYLHAHAFTHVHLHLIIKRTRTYTHRNTNTPTHTCQQEQWAVPGKAETR